MGKIYFHQKTKQALFLGMICVSLILGLCGVSIAQNKEESGAKIKVGLTVSPPAIMKGEDTEWEGFSVEVWKNVAQRMNLPYEFLEFKSTAPLIDALEKREIDVIPSLAVRYDLEPIIDFSQSYLKSGLGIAVPVENYEFSLLHILGSIFSTKILKSIGLLVFMSMIAGVLVWTFERSRNGEMFGEKAAEGIGDGIWWAVVTMTTVGYGDKAPKTTAGRITSLVWMVFSIIFIALFTANITASVTISQMKGKVRGFEDLYHARVGSITGSEGFDFLTKKKISLIHFGNIQEGLQAVADRRIDTFVYDKILLKYSIVHEFQGQIQLLPETFDEYFISIALQQKSPLRKPVNQALLKMMESDQWEEMVGFYSK